MKLRLDTDFDEYDPYEEDRKIKLEKKQRQENVKRQREDDRKKDHRRARQEEF